jgi:hypothetical protein
MPSRSKATRTIEIDQFVPRNEIDDRYIDSPTTDGKVGQDAFAGRGIMPRKLKTFQTSLGFYDLAIAAPAMKAALEAFSPQGRTCVREGAARRRE